MTTTAQALVEQMVAAGEWPEPQLFENILAEGAEAIPPLLDVIRREVHGWPEEAPVCYAIDLLGALGAVQAIPDLVQLFYRYDNETLESLSVTLGVLGPGVIDGALAVVRDNNRGSYARAMAGDAAILAAGEDPNLRERIAAACREVLAGYLERGARGMSEEDSNVVSSMVSDLSNLADPQALDLIRQAYAAEIVDEFFIGLEDVEESYREGRAEVNRPERRAWLEEYRELYQSEMRAREESTRRAAAPPRQPPVPAPPRQPPVPAPPRQPPVAAATAAREPRAPLPIEREGPRVGRNDPCPCGSGKKYKNCHMRQERS